MNYLKKINLKGYGKVQSGKVRDFYIYQDYRIIITTDRISAFDVVLGSIAHKGQVLNLISEFWFKKTSSIVKNHMVFIPHPNVIIAQNAKLIPVEVVVRGYITGVTDTSIWGSYEKGERKIYGIKFPEGLKKNQILPKPVITPTTKASVGHDERLTREEIISKKIVPKKLYEEIEKTALKLFKKGSEVANKSGLILVDTKYEFGLDKNGKLILIDEIHTPDSSRFWVKKTYAQRFKKGQEPEGFDKEFMRIWYANKGYKGKGKAPEMPDALAKKVSSLYVNLYKKLIGKSPPRTSKNVEKEIQIALDNYFKK